MKKIILLLLGVAFFLAVLKIVNKPASVFSLGIVSNVMSTTANCPSGYICNKFTIICPNITNLTGAIAVGNAIGQPKGVATFSTGQSGVSFYSNEGSDVALWMQNLRNSGLTIVQIRWDESWWSIAGTNPSGIAQLACRPATIIKYIHDTYYLPLGLGRKSFIATGNSGGASQVAYPLAYYGLDEIVDVAIPTGGPPHSALQKSCMNTPEEKDYWLGEIQRERVDNSYGIIGGGPCLNHNATWIPTWLADSVGYGGNNYYYPNTIVHQIIGSEDYQMLTTAHDYRNALLNTPFYTWEVATSTPHAVFKTVNGRKAIGQVILKALE